MSGELPNGWVSATVGEVADVQLGKMLSAAAKTGRGARPYLRNVNVRWHRVAVDDVLAMDFDAREVEKYTLRTGDVLVCEGGEPGRAAVWRDQLPGALYQKALHRVRFRGGAMLPELFVYHLEFLATTGALAGRFTGSTIKHLPRETFVECDLRLPPLEEQRRIVAALEEHLSDLDAAVAGLERARANIVRYRTAVRDAAIGNQTSSQAGVTNGAAVCDWASGDYLPQKAFVAGPHPVYGGNGVSGHHAEYNVSMPTLVVGRVGAHCGNVHVSSGKVWVTDNAIYAKRIAADASIAYLRLVFEAARLNDRAAGSGQPFVNQRMLNEVEFRLPPLTEQRAIVEDVERRLTAADRTAAELDVQLARAARLRQAILQRAFAGRLVPQDPADEPAAALLARVRAERASTPRAPRRAARANA